MTDKVKLINETFTLTKTLAACEPHTHTFTAHGVPYVIDANTLATFRVNAAVQEFIAHDPKLPDRLLFGSRFRPVETQSETPIRFVVLNLTNKCNLSCKYCFVEQGDAAMSPDIVCKALDLLKDTDTPSIGFFGGEPTLAENIMRYAVQEARDRFKSPRFTLTTNATALSANFCRWIADRGFSVIVSIDGPREIHEESRGLGTFRKVIHGLEMLKDANVRVTARATYSPENIHLVERAMFLGTLTNKGYATSYSLEPAASKTPWPKRIQSELECLSNWLATDPMRLKDAWHYQAIIRRIKLGEPHTCNCGAGIAYVTVSPTGEVHACHRQGSLIGRVGGDIDRSTWGNRKLRDGCETCWAKYICGSGCRASTQFEGIAPPRAPLCDITRRIIRECVWLADQDTDD